jgi:hypothetical protein
MRVLWMSTPTSVLVLSERTSVVFLQRGIYVAGLREEIVNSAEQVFELLQQGEGTPLPLCFLY